MNIHGRIDFDSLLQATLDAIPIVAISEMSPMPFDKEARVIVNNQRIYYSDDDPAHQLPKGHLQPFSVVHQSYDLCLTPELVDYLGPSSASLHGISQEVMLAEGGYADLDKNDHWWIPSSRKLFSDGPKETSAIHSARSSFYIPSFEVDSLGNQSTVKHDDYMLLVEEYIDAVGNKIKTENDYLRLQPVMITDANLNRTCVSLDALGAVAGMAVMGKENEEVGDSLEDFAPTVAAETVDSLISSPTDEIAKTLLGHAGRRIIYRDPRGLETPTTSATPLIPACIIELSRARHFRDGAGEIEIKILYTNGKGELIQQVELLRIL